MAGLLCPCRCGRACRMPEPSTRGGGQLGKGTRARHKLFGRCACVCGFRAPYCGFARAFYTTVFLTVLLWFGVGCLYKARQRRKAAGPGGPGAGASPVSALRSPPSVIRSLAIEYRVSLDSLGEKTLPARVPPGTTAPLLGPGSVSYVKFATLVAHAGPVSTLQRLTEALILTRERKLLPTSMVSMPPGWERTIRQIPYDDHSASCTTTETPPATSTINAACPAIGPSPSPSQLDTYTPSPTATSSPLLVVHAKLDPAHPHASCMRLPFANVAWCSSSRCDAMQ